MTRRLSLSPARRGVTSIAAGTAIGQALLVLAAPWLARLYDPSTFGVFSVINAVVLAAGTVSALRFDMAVPLPDEDDEARGLVRLGLLLCAAVALVGTCLVWTLYELGVMPADGQWPQLSLAIWAPLGAALMGAYLVLNQLAVRARAYGAIATRNVLQAAATVAMQIAAGLAGWSEGGLLLGLVAGQALGVASLAWGMRADLRRAFGARWPLRPLIVRYRASPLLLAPAGFVNNLGAQAPLIAITSLYGTEAAGSFGMAQRVLAMPLALVGMAISQVLMGEISSRKREQRGPAMPLFMSVTKKLAIVGSVGALITAAAGPPLFAVALGAPWKTSGLMAQGLALGLLAQFVAAPLSQTTIIAGRNVAQLCWDLMRLVSGIASIAAAAWYGLDAVAAVWAVGMVTAVLYCGLWLISRSSVVKIDKGAARSTLLAPGQ